MGLAPYGDSSICAGALDKYFPRFEGKELVKRSDISSPGYWEENAALQFQIDEAEEVATLVEMHGKEAVAAEAQRLLEENTLSLVEGWFAERPVKRIAFAGGVILNVKLNQKVWYAFKDRISEHHCFPNPGDSGEAIGSALLSYYRDHEFRGGAIKTLHLGPEYSNQEIQKCLDIRKVAYKKVSNVTEAAAALLADNKIIAWFQGRMESGPRALGSRSILMSPLQAVNKEVINATVKFREAFRPFCPSLIIEKRDEYLIDARDERFMITSFLVREEKKDKIPAVVHVDGSVRPQMVEKDVNPLYHALISRFGELTGEYILLNTSFNVMGEAIVNTPAEAVRCFYDSGIDALVIGDFIVEKQVSG
jgi:carbamoyltransferase